MDKKTLLKIKKIAIKIDWNDAFNGKSKGNQHLFRITSVAKFLAQKTDANPYIVEVGALLHDVALPSGDHTNQQENKKIISGLLKPFHLDKTDIDNITECVTSHEGTIKPKTLEAQVVHDADVLEKTGLLGIIRHTWKLTNLEKIKNNAIDDGVMHDIINHIKWRGSQLQTILAKKIHRYLSINIDYIQAKKIIQKVSKLAQAGIITENIASSLSEELTIKQRKKLKEQLDLSYLMKFD